MNSDKLKSICHKVSKNTGVHFNAVLTHYFLETILQKIASSEENDNFVFKGGFLLSSLVGIGSRNTLDMDFLIRKFSLTKENILDRFEKILQSGDDTGIVYEIQNIKEIRQQDEYGGYCLKVLCKLEKVKQIIPLDVATGDPITPSDIIYEYKSVFSDNSFKICAYNIETMLAEKLQTLYVLEGNNSRSKDFYDLYILYLLKKDQIDFSIFKEACERTFKHRKTEFDIDSVLNKLSIIRNSPFVVETWNAYQRRTDYAQGISFDEVISTIQELVMKMA